MGSGESPVKAALKAPCRLLSPFNIGWLSAPVIHYCLAAVKSKRGERGMVDACIASFSVADVGMNFMIGRRRPVNGQVVSVHLGKSAVFFKFIGWILKACAAHIQFGSDARVFENWHLAFSVVIVPLPLLH